MVIRDLNIGIVPHDLARRLQSTDARHVHIHEDHINLIGTAPLSGILATVDLSDHGQTFDILQDATDSGTDKFMVINKKHTDQRVNSRG